MSWPEVPIGEIFEVARGGSPRPIDKFITDDPNGLNWVMIGDATAGGKYINETKKKIRPEGLKKTREVEPGDFILSNSMSFGKPYIMGIKGCIHDGWLLLRPQSDQIYPDYFYHLLGSEPIYQKFASRAAGATVKNLNSGIVREVEIPLPPLAEQKRIAGILDQAAELCRLRTRALEKLNTLGQAIFYEMFGEDAKSAINRKDQCINDFCEVSSGSTPSRREASFFEGDIPWVKTGEVCGRTIFDTDEKITQEAVRSARLTVFPVNTVLIAMYGQGKTRGQVGMLGIPAATNQACAALVPHNDLHPEFLFQQLLISYDRLRDQGRGGNQPNLNAGMIKNFPIYVPSYDHQIKFVERVMTKKSLVASNERCANSCSRLFASLQHRAFRGEL